MADREYVVAGPERVNLLDTADQDLIRVRVRGDTYDRFVLQGDGTSVTGTGSAPPTPSGTITTFDAGGNQSAARPSVPTTTTVVWLNVPGQPTNLGANDLWVSTTSVSGGVLTSTMLKGAGGASVSTTSTSYVRLNALLDFTFVVPSTGVVIVRLVGPMRRSAGSGSVYFTVLDRDAADALVEANTVYECGNTSNANQIVEWRFSGLTAGTTKHWTIGAKVGTGGATADIIYGFGVLTATLTVLAGA